VIGAVGIGKAAAFAVLRIAHLRQVAALQVVATTLEMAPGRARLRYDRQQYQRCRQRDDKHSHDLAPRMIWLPPLITARQGRTSGRGSPSLAQPD
jgi:hypothetical protein